MPNIPDAASYVAPMGAGLQIGLGLARQQQDRQQFMQSLAEKKRESQFTEGIQNAQAARQAKEFQDTQDWQKGFATDFQSEIEKESSKNKDMGLGADVNNAFSQPTRTPQQIQNEVLSRWLPRAPAPVLEKLAPMMQRQMITPYQQSQLDVRNRAVDARETAIDATKNTADRRAVDRERAPIVSAATAAGLFDEMWPNGLYDEDGKPIAPKPEGSKKLADVQKTAKQYSLTPAQVRTINVMLQSDPEFNSETPQRQQELTSRFLANKGVPVGLSGAEFKEINAQDDLVRSTQKVADIVEQYKDSFGLPNAAKAWIGQYTGSDPKLVEINQVFRQLKQGQASSIGGKAITPAEMRLVTDAIGTPDNANFRVMLPNYLKTQAELMAKKLDSVKQRGVQYNPNFREVIRNEWEPNLQSTVQSLDKRGLKLSKQYQFNGENSISSPANAESEKANSLRSKYNY